eukprot:88509-Rhodomonas_salina.1
MSPAPSSPEHQTRCKREAEAGARGHLGGSLDLGGDVDGILEQPALHTYTASMMSALVAALSAQRGIYASRQREN